MTHEERMERRAQLAEQVRKGKNAKEVAKAHGVSYGLVQAACAEHGVDLTDRGSGSVKHWTCYEILAHLFDPKVTMVSIAADMRVSHTRVSEVYKQAMQAGVPGLPLRGADTFQAPTKEDLLLYLGDTGQKFPSEIAKHFCTTVPRVYSLLKSSGWFINEGKGRNLSKSGRKAYEEMKEKAA